MSVFLIGYGALRLQYMSNGDAKELECETVHEDQEDVLMIRTSTCVQHCDAYVCARALYISLYACLVCDAHIFNAQR
jgi:hypothetical protein